MSDARQSVPVLSLHTGTGRCDVVVRRRPDPSGGAVAVCQVLRFDSMDRCVMPYSSLSLAEALALAEAVLRQKMDPRDPSVPVKLAGALHAVTAGRLAAEALAAEADADAEGD